jgi:chromodomain-helicase-DNA-binding protein 7
MYSHAYVPSSSHVPSPFSHSTASQHRSDSVGSGSQQQAPPPSSQQPGSISSNTMPHITQISQTANQSTGATNVHQSNNGSVMDSHMQSRFTLNQPYMMTNPYMHNAFYNQPSGASTASGSYYGYDQSYSQVPSDPYSHSNSASTSHWPTSAPPSSMMSNSPLGSSTAQLRPPTGPSGSTLPPAQVATTPLPPLTARPPLTSRTPERSPAPPMTASYPSPNQQGASKAGSNSLAQLEQMVMPGSAQTTTPLKSPNHRSTTSSPSTNTLQPQTQMQYSYNSSGSGSYFNSATNQNQSSYYTSYESSDSIDPNKSSWSEQTPSTVMAPPPPTGSSMDGNVGAYSQPQGYEGSSGYGDYTQLSTPSQSRFTSSSDMPTDQPQADKSDPYAIDSQTFEDHEDQGATPKTKKGRAKKNDDPTKKERRQRAPRGSKAAAAAAASAAASAAAAAAAAATTAANVAATTTATANPTATAAPTPTPTAANAATVAAATPVVAPTPSLSTQPQSPSISSMPVQQPTPASRPTQSVSLTPEVPQIVTDTSDQVTLPAETQLGTVENTTDEPYANHDGQSLVPKVAMPSNQVEQVVAPNGASNSNFSKSPVQRSTTSSPIVTPQQPQQPPQQQSQYTTYGPMGPESYNYNSNSSANQSGYYPSYESASSSTAPQPETSWQTPPVPPTMNSNQTSSSISVDNNSVMYDPNYSGPSNYGQYTRISTPPPSKIAAAEQTQQESSQIDKSDLTLAESQSGGEQDDQTPVVKPKRSRSKRSDESSKKERKQRASKSQKSSTPGPQSESPHEDSTVLNELPTIATEEKETGETSEVPAEVPADQDETQAGDDKAEVESKTKPKKNRSKKSEEKPKRERKSRAAPKLPTPSQNDESTPPSTLIDQPDVIATATNESFQDEQPVAAAVETTPAKPKRIRIRDSSSKGKKKLPKFALKFAKTKKRKRLGSSDNEQSDLDKTPPPSPDEAESGVQKRRSARNTKKLKYNDDIELGFSDSDDENEAPVRKKSSNNTTTEGGDSVEESVIAEEPTVFAAPVEDTMVVEKIMASRTGTRELEPEPGEVLPPDGTFIDVEEFYVKYKNMSYLHCDWRTLEELEKGDRRVAQKIKRYKQKKDNSNVFSFMDEDLFDPQYCEVDRILAVNEVEEMVPDSEDEAEVKKEQAAETEVKLETQNVDQDQGVKSEEYKSTEQDRDDSNNPDSNKPQERTEATQNPDSGDTQKQDTEMADQSIADEKPKVETDVKDVEMKDESSQLSVEKAPIEDASAELKSKPAEVPAEEKPKKMKKKISRHYLVKWRALSYEDSTWELEEHLDPEKIKHFERFKDPPPKSKWRPVKRPKPEEWVRKEVSPIYKNGNTLREYQLEGINWLSFCWHQGRNCILADEMGLGKTIQSIAFINEIYQKGIHGPFLIIVPLSTVGNWAREFETWTDLNVITYHGSSTSREMLKEYEMYYRNEQGNRITSVYKFQVMITTFEIVLSDCLDLREIPWRCCIIDEAHRLKNRNCKLLEGLRLLNMEHRVLLTGTPLQNNVEELFSLLNFLEPTQFSSTEQFLQEFGDLKTEAQVDKLKLILKPMMLRRLKEDVEKTLAPKEETIVEVELTNIQKKYYRAILERNFSFLQKGSTNNNMPNLMNTMMELRKCCIHPYLINGAEEQILYEARQTKMAGGEPMSSHQAMVNASGKLVLIDKLLPRLRADGHRVLIFSQMVRCLDILEDYVTNKHYPYERIDGRVRGSDRQQAIDRFSKPGSDRFVFLLCTRAGGLGINLTAADTVIIFDSDWNPQNDLQAQARCHRIGQSKAVKIYRLICRNTYEREMFDKASLKLGLDKAVLQSMNTQKATGVDGQLTKKEIEELLRKGAYGALMDDDNAGDKFCEEDIDQILQRRTQVITIESTEAKGSTFSKATFSSSNNREDIELDDPNFWEKWAKKANIEADDLLSKDDLIQLAPRRRTQTKRYGADGTLIEMSDLESSEEDEETISMRTRGSRRGQSKPTPASASKRGKRNKMFDQDDDDFIANIDGGYWSKSDCLKIEAGLLTYGWGRWDEIIKNNRFKRDISTEDCESICRVILLYCLNSYKGDEKIKSFVWELIMPPEESSKNDSENNANVSTRGRKPRSSAPLVKKSVAEEILDANWPKEAKNDPLIALPDDQYRRHLQRNCNR